MATREQFQAAARRWLDRGTRETPPGSNHVPGVTDQPGFWDDAWCAMWASVVCREVGIPLWTAAVAGIVERAQNGTDGWSWHTVPIIGAMSCYDWLDGGQRTDHVGGGGVTAILGGGRFRNMEGNTRAGMVEELERTVSSVMGWALPPFSDGPSGGGGGARVLSRGARGPAVADAQAKLNALGYGLEVDGDFGPATDGAVRDLQTKRGLEVDGEIGPATWAVLDAGPGNTPPTPPPVHEPPSVPSTGVLPLDVDGDFGPPQIGRPHGRYQSCKALQAVVGTDADGDFGSQTCRATQRHLGVDADGNFGPESTKACQRRVGLVGADVDGEFGSQTAEAAQRALNAGAF